MKFRKLNEVNKLKLLKFPNSFSNVIEMVKNFCVLTFLSHFTSFKNSRSNTQPIERSRRIVVIIRYR